MPRTTLLSGIILLLGFWSMPLLHYVDERSLVDPISVYSYVFPGSMDTLSHIRMLTLPVFLVVLLIFLVGAVSTIVQILRRKISSAWS